MKYDFYGELEWDPSNQSLGMRYPGGELVPVSNGDHQLFVDGTNGSDLNNGLSWSQAFKTIQMAIDSAKPNYKVFVKAQTIPGTVTDPVSYAENLIIPATCSGLQIIGMGGPNRTQGGMPQLKTSVAGAAVTILIIRAAGVLIYGMGINGAGNTAGGILLDDDGTAKEAFGTAIINCHFKNCVGSTATDGRTGGAIMWTAAGNAWQVLIKGNRFYKNVADVVLKGTSNSVPQDVVIEDNIFSGPTASVDVNLWLAGGSGMNGVVVRNNVFPSVLPSLSSGSIVRYVDMTGCVGIFSGNTVGGVYTTTGFGVAKAAAKIPLTVGIAKNYSDSGLIVREA